MRTSAITALILGIATVSPILTADDDFSALLADLSFSDAPAPAIQESLSVAAEKNTEELKPVPTGLTMPQLVESTPEAQLSTDTVEMAPRTAVDIEPEVETQDAARVALKDPIVSVEEDHSDSVDFDAAFGLQNNVAIANAVPTQVVGHVRKGYHAGGCDAEIICRPHIKPVLPSSSFYQYFRTEPCYANVWDGYQRRCGDHHKHLHGTCDCFEKSRARTRGRSACGGGCNGSDCTSCDAAYDQ